MTDPMREAFEKHYGPYERFRNEPGGNDWYCEKLGGWASAWDDAVTYERDRCAAIVTIYTDETHPGPVQMAARRMLVAIEGG